MRFKKLIGLSTVMPAAICGAAAQATSAATAPLVLAERVRIHSARLGEDRAILVALPSNYRAGTSRYPVLYVLDGEENILTAASAAHFLASAGRVPEMIVVGIVNRDRERDFTPPLHRTTQLPPGIERAGGADRFIAFLGDEVIPRVDSTFRTRPLRVLVGHSLGGLLAMQALALRPSLFRRFVTVDPSLWWDAGDVVDSVHAAAARYTGPTIRIAAVRGDTEDARRMFAAATSIRATQVEVQQESHPNLMYRGLYDGLIELFGDYVPYAQHDLAFSSVRALRAQYATLSIEFGYDVPVPLSALLKIANNEARQRRYAKAYEALDEAKRLYPASSTVASWRNAIETSQAEATRSGLRETKSPLRFTSVSAAGVAPLLGRWTMRMYSPSPSFHALSADAEFELHGDTLVYQSTVHGVAFDGGDFKELPSIVEVNGKRLRWARENPGGGIAVTTVTLNSNGSLGGREDLEQGDPLPAGFTPPQTYVELKRAKPD